MKRGRSLHLIAVLCAAALYSGTAGADEVRVAVATNFADAMAALVTAFEAKSEHQILVSTGSTGSHYAQIKNGAPFDAFFSADAERPLLLEREGVAVAGSRFRYASGRLVLWSPMANYVDDVGAVLATGTFRRLALANPQLAPYGAAARDVLRARGVWEHVSARLVQGQDVGQAFAFVATGNAELGFVALAQIKRPGVVPEGSYWLVPAELHARIDQHAVLLRDTPAARAFTQFVRSDAGRAIVRDYGYEP